MPTIVKRGSRFMARVRKDGFPQLAKTFLKKADAVAWGRRIEADMQAGRWKAERRAVPTLAEALKEYQAKVARSLKGAQTYRYTFNALEQSPLAALRLDLVTPAKLADWRDTLSARGLKNATVCRHMGTLSGALTWAHKERGLIDANPLRAVSRPVVRDARTRTLDNDEARYLDIATRGARAAWLADAVTLLLRTAMRRSELVGLRCDDVLLDQSIARLRDSKNGEARDVPLCTIAKAALARLLADATAHKRERVLPISDPEAISFAFRRAVVRAQERYAEDCATSGTDARPGFLDGVRLHDLRHHAISTWARTGALSIVDLMKISGHKSPRMLARYAHINASDLAERMAKLAA